MVQYSTVFQVMPRAPTTYFALWEKGLFPFGNSHLPSPKPHYNLFFLALVIIPWLLIPKVESNNKTWKLLSLM